MRRWWTFAAPAGFVVLLLLVVSRWTPLRDLDRDVADGLNRATAPHASLVSLWKAVSTVGQPLTFQVLAAVVAIVLWQRRRMRAAFFAALTVLPTGLLTNVVKASVGRDRPTVPDPVAHASASSFPSGHALSSFVGVTVLLLVLLPLLRHRLRPAAVGTGALVVLLVAFSRLALGVHYLSDVLAGWLLGATWVTLTYVLVLTKPRWRVPPRAVPGRPLRTPAG